MPDGARNPSHADALAPPAEFVGNGVGGEGVYEGGSFAAPLLEVNMPATNAKTAMAIMASGQWDFKTPARFWYFMACTSPVHCHARGLMSSARQKSGVGAHRSGANRRLFIMFFQEWKCVRVVCIVGVRDYVPISV